MRRAEDRKLSKHTMNLYDGTISRLQALYPRVGAAKIIRDILWAHIRKIEEDAAQRIPMVVDLDLDIEEIDHVRTE